ncbi:PAS domain S-box protein [Chryseolinea soli]|uniref:histidine kinase n=1 Tax=Chryseolinea soli TaxID=2321403 RepID=A0A385SHZ7_9BACT|nr:PAS domain S-box protein [Chryseolinea soli]AYB29545.1 PAS domain S-box protein [Chryseolinea soli]
MVLSQNVKRWSHYFSGTCLLLATLVLVGWQFDVEIFKRPMAGLAAMNPMTALCFLCANTALWLVQSSHRTRRYVAYGLAAFCFLVGVWRVLSELSHSIIPVDTLLFSGQLQNDFPDKGSVRMAVASGLNFMGFGILLMPFRAIRNAYVTQAAVSWIGLAAWFSVLGYVFSVPEFYGDLPFNPMAIHTAACFLLTSLAWLMLRPDEGFMKEVHRKGPGGTLARALLPTIFLLPLAIGYLRLQAQAHYHFSTEFGVAILVSSITFFLTFITWLCVKMINVRDEQREEIEMELWELNMDLKERNDEIAALNEELNASNEEISATLEEVTAANEELTLLNEQLSLASETIREQAEVILQQKDEQLNRTLDAMDVMVWSIDLTDKQKHFMSRTIEQILGVKGDELLQNNGRSFTNWVVPEDRHLREASIKELETQPTSEVSYRIRDKDGNLRWLEVRNRLLRDEYGKPQRREGVAMDATLKRQQEEAIRQYKENLQIIFSNTLEEILLLDYEGRIVMFNEALEKFIAYSTGKKPEVGMYVWDMTVAERHDIAKELFFRVRGGEDVTVEAPIHLATEDLVHELRYSPVVIDGQVKYVTIISIDITEKKRQEQTVLRSEANLQAIFNHTNDIFTLLDEQYNIVMFNQANKTAFTEYFQVGANIIDLLPEEHRGVFLLSLQRTAGGEFIEYEMEYGMAPAITWYRVTMETIYTDNRLTGYCITAHDYTDIKRAAITLRESEERFRALIENSEDVVGMMEPAGRMIYVNPGVERVTGYSPEDFLVMNLETIINPESKNEYQRFFDDVRHNPHKLISTSFRSRHKNGHWQWMEGTAINLLDVEGIQSIVTNFRDVTGRRKSEEERSLLLSQLIERNNDLLQFSFIASHNLRGPVASMLGLINLMGMEEMPDDTRSMLSMVRHSANRLDEVIKDLSAILEMRSHEVHAKEDVPIHEITDSICQALQTQIDESHARIAIDAKETQVFYTIRSYFYSILYNLISNAIKYRSPRRNPVIEISTFKTPTTTGVRVRDNGMGIDLDQFGDKIFMLYQRFHLEVEGKGMGLHMVKTQVNSLNGSIDIKSTPGVGTTFTIHFPV